MPGPDTGPRPGGWETLPYTISLNDNLTIIQNDSQEWNDEGPYTIQLD
jgi:hypothetical protein